MSRDSRRRRAGRSVLTRRWTLSGAQEEVEQLREEKEELADDKLTLFQSLSDMRAQLDQQATNTAVLKAQLGQAQSELNETHDKLKQEQDATESDKTRALQRQIDSLTQEKDAALLDVKVSACELACAHNPSLGSLRASSLSAKKGSYVIR